MKALEVLKYAKKHDAHITNDMIDEAIAELQELMKPKTCSGCRKEYIDHTDCMECKRNTKDKYEPREMV